MSAVSEKTMKPSGYGQRLLVFGILSFLSFMAIFSAITLFWQPLQRGELVYTSSSGNVATSISDFVHFYAAGKMVLSSDHYQVFDPDVQLRWINELISPAHTESIFYMQYVPFVFPLMAPFAFMPITQAYFLWDGLTLLTGAGALYFFCRRLRKWNGQLAAILVLYTLISCPSILTLRLGQTSWLIVALLCLYCWALERGRDIAGGISLALIAIKPQYVILLAVPALALRRWRLILFSIGAELVLLSISAACIGWRNVVFFPKIVMHAETSSRYCGVSPEQMISIRSLLSIFFLPKLALTLSFALMFAVIIPLFLLWRRSASLDSEAFRWAFVITVLTCLVFSPHSHPYDALLLCVPAALTVSFNRHDVSRAVWMIWTALLLSFPLVSFYFCQSEISQTYRRLPFLAEDIALLALAVVSWFGLSKSVRSTSIDSQG